MRHTKAPDSDLCICGSKRVFKRNVGSYVEMQCQARAAERTREWKRRQAKSSAVVKSDREPSPILLKRALANEVKSDNPCADCGESFPPYVMDFDHVRGVKEFGIGSAVLRAEVTVDAFAAEIDKCDVVCSNCHRERTFGPNAHQRVERSTPYDHKTG